MSISFGEMIPRDITEIKMKMPITRNLTHHQQNLHKLNNVENEQVSSSSMKTFEKKISIADIRAFFKNR